MRAFSIERTTEMVRKELRQALRDPRMRLVLFVAPLIQLFMFGYAISTDVRDVSTFVVDHDRTRASRDLVEALTASGYFQVTGRSSRMVELTHAIDHGDARIGLRIPPGFEAALSSGGPARVQAIIDGTNSNTATVALGYAEQFVVTYGASLAPVEVRPPIEIRERAWFNPGLTSRDYNVPAVIGAILLLVCLLLTALAVVRERELGTLEQLMVSPLTRWELIVGKTLPFVFVGLVDVAVSIAIAVGWFKIPFHGSVLLLMFSSLLFMLPALGLGLTVSTISSTQQEAFMTTFLIFIPTLILAGFMFPIRSMPEVFQWLTLLNPVRHYLEIVRGIFLKGSGVAALWPQMLTLFGMGVGLLSLAASRFRKTAR